MERQVENLVWETLVSSESEPWKRLVCLLLMSDISVSLENSTCNCLTYWSTALTQEHTEQLDTFLNISKKKKIRVLAVTTLSGLFKC